MTILINLTRFFSSETMTNKNLTLIYANFDLKTTYVLSTFEID